MARVRIQVRVVASSVALTSALVMGMSVQAAAQSWTALDAFFLNTDRPGVGGRPDAMRLLTDGSVMVQSCNTAATCNRWMRLTPSSTGSYANGTWSADIAPMSIPRLAYASHVLPSGKVWILGGEQSGPALEKNITGTGEIYDPVANRWSPIAPHPEAQFGDDPTMLLNNGHILAGSIFTRNTYLYSIANDTWSGPSLKVYDDRSDEEAWVLLPDGRVLTYDTFQSIATGGSYAEVYDPRTNAWSSISPSDGSANGFIPQLSSDALGQELGPLMRLHDGRIIVFGVTGHTALYTPSTNTWAAGPDILADGLLWGAGDASAAVMPNGHVMFLADANPQAGAEFRNDAPTKIFDFNPSTNTISLLVPQLHTQGLDFSPAFIKRLLLLPNGQVLLHDGSFQFWVYTPAGSADPTLRPVVNAVTYNGGGMFTLTGKQLNGQSAGSAFGDEFESDENYPVVRLTNASGTFYARTTNWSNNLVATGSARETVDFTLHPGMTPGNYSLIVSGAGISGVPLFVKITANQIAGGPP